MEISKSQNKSDIRAIFAIHAEAVSNERKRILSTEITEQDLQAIEALVSSRYDWNQVDHRKLVLACVQVVCEKSE